MYLSVCSGIEAASCAWKPLGWHAFAFAEIEPFPSAVLAYHYPNVPNLGDMSKFTEWHDATLDLLVGGTPCQSFSVAGLRKGLDDPRGNLMLTYLAIARRYRPRWLVWENVPGVLSSGGGRDFAAFLRGLDELGYGWSYRVLDAQYFGVAQRRRRVFVVGHFGNWRRAAAVLFERHSLQGHPAPSRQTGKGLAQAVAECLRAGGNSTGGDRPPGTDVDTAGTYLLPVPHADISPAIKARDSKGVSSDGDGDGAILVPMASSALPVAFDTTQITSKANFSNPQPGDACHPLARCAHPPAIAFSSKDHGADAMVDVAPTLRAGGHADSHANAGVPPAIAFHGSQDPDVSGDVTHPIGRNHGQETCIAFNPVQEGMGLSSVAAPLGASVGGGNQGAVATTMHVRRLTPRECERLQGFKDDYTLIPWRGKSADQCPDGPRYKALGNSMAVPVMHWIGRRIQMVEEIE